MMGSVRILLKISAPLSNAFLNETTFSMIRLVGQYGTFNKPVVVVDLSRGYFNYTD